MIASFFSGLPRALWLTLLVGTLGACVQDDPGPALPGVDLAYFECGVQPLLDRDCSFPACHGNPGRPLFTYSASKTRSLGDALRGEALTDFELCSNFASARSFAVAKPSQLIQKPLARSEAGSQYHVGQAFFAADSIEAACLEGWLAGEGWLAAPDAGPAAPPRCAFAWRQRPDGTFPACAPRTVDCGAALARGETPGGSP